MGVKMYRSFREFEQQELYRMDPLYQEIDQIVDSLFLDGLDARFGAQSEQEGDDSEEWS